MVLPRQSHGPPTVASRTWHGHLVVASWTDDGPSAVTQRVRHGCQRSRHATGVSRRPNTGLSLSTLTASGCHGLARIASPEMLPWSDLLPHLICSPPSNIGGGGDGVDQHGDTRRAGGCAGRAVRLSQPEGTRTDPGRIRRCEWLASQASDAFAPRRAGQSAVRLSAGAALI